MKALFTCLLCLSYIGAKSQVILKTNLLYPLVGGSSLAVEVATSQHSSLTIYGAFGSKGGYLLLADDYSFQNLIVEQRFYKSSSTTSLAGFYYGPYLKYMHREVYRKGVDAPFIFSQKTKNFDAHSVGLGTVLGTQVPVKRVRGMVLDAFIGIGYLVNVQQTDYVYPPENRFGHLDLRTGIAVGYQVSAHKSRN